MHIRQRNGHDSAVRRRLHHHVRNQGESRRDVDRITEQRIQDHRRSSVGTIPRIINPIQRRHLPHFTTTSHPPYHSQHPNHGRRKESQVTSRRRNGAHKRRNRQRLKGSMKLPLYYRNDELSGNLYTFRNWLSLFISVPCLLTTRNGATSK